MVLTITCPHEGVPVHPAQPLAYTASEAIESTQWAVDGSPIESAWKNRTVIDALWDTTQIPNGVHTLSLVATAVSGERVSVEMVVTVAN